MVKLSLVYDKVRWEEKALYEAAKGLNVPLKMVDAEEAIFNISANDSGEDFGDLVLERCVSHYTGFHVAAILEGYGYKVVNSARVIMLCGNKLLTTIALRRAGLPVPKTYVAFTANSALKAFDKVGVSHLLCYEISDRDGLDIAEKGLNETENYLISISIFIKVVDFPDCLDA